MRWIEPSELFGLQWGDVDWALREVHIQRAVVERPWKHILKTAKVRYRNPYQSRHTYASQLLSGGENPLFVAQQMGHKTTEMIMRHYGRWVE